MFHGPVKERGKKKTDPYLLNTSFHIRMADIK